MTELITLIQFLINDKEQDGKGSKSNHKTEGSRG
jgi:hypothetical protein